MIRSAAMGKKDAEKEGFHSPFAAVGKELKKKLEAEAQAKLEAERRAKAPRPPTRVAPSPAPRAPTRRNEPVPETRELTFAELMDGVRPVQRTDPREQVPAGPIAPEVLQQRDLDEADALATLAGLVEGSGLLEEGDDDDVLEGWTKGLDRKVMRTLKRGDYGVAARLDLHGMRQEPARQAVERFVTEGHDRGHRCLLIIHGRGLNSEAGVPVLKRALQEWLARGRVTRHILAFCTASPQDGGAGAVYVLLRR